MSTSKDHDKLTDGLGLENDCPLCGASWPMCHGLCVAHEAAHGRPGPFHSDYNDDCIECCDEILAGLLSEDKAVELVHASYGAEIQRLREALRTELNTVRKLIARFEPFETAAREAEEALKKVCICSPAYKTGRSKGPCPVHTERFL